MRSYVINLDGDRDRWQKVKAALESVGLYPERVPGILYDGKNHTPETDMLRAARPSWHPPLPRSVCGCFASHLRAVGTFLKHSQDKYCIIFEDDVAPIAKNPEEFSRELQWTLDNAPGDWKGISLHSDFVLPGGCPEGLWVGKTCTSNAAYILNREGAQQLLREPWKVCDWYKQITWDKFYVRPKNMFITDETSSLNATWKSKSTVHVLLDNIRGKQWCIRGEKPMSYALSYPVTAFGGHNVRTSRVIQIGLLIGICLSKGFTRWVLVVVLLLFIPVW